MRHTRQRCSRVLAAAACLTLPGLGAAETPSLSLSAPTLTVSAFSPSPTLRVEGRVGEGAAVVVTVRGPDVTETFNVKGRVGPIWATTGKVEISGAPALILSFSERPLDTLLSRAAIDRFGLDARAVAARIRVEPPGADDPEVRRSYLELKLEEGSYRNVAGLLRRDAEAGGEGAFTLEFAWPANGRPGRYTVTVYECRDGGVAGTGAVPLEVVESGIAAGLKGLAARHGGAYGALAVGVTMSLGFGIDFLLARIRRRRAGSRPGRAAATRGNVAAH